MAKRQKEFAGMTPAKHAAVEEAAEIFVEASAKSKEAREQREAASHQLIMEMKAAKISAYRFDGKLVSVSAKAKVTVKADDEDGE